MSLQEIREEMSLGTWDPSVAGEGWVLYVKKINLNRFRRFETIHVDFMDDSQIIPQTADFAYEFFVSVFPVHPTNMRFAEQFTNGGPAAADDNVLFKSVGYNINVIPSNPMFTPYVVQNKEQFPNQFLASMPTFNFYSPHVYLNLLIHTNVLAEGADPLQDMRMSVYLAMNESEVNDITWQIGRIREVNVAAYKELITAGVVQNTSLDTLNPSGRWISWPAWTWGGQIPERMMRIEGTAAPSSAIASAFVNLGSDTPETMLTNDQMETFFNTSRTMQPAGTAFGGRDVALGDIPDWLNFSSMTEVYGEVRDEFPPRKFPDTAQVAAGFDESVAFMV